MRPCYASDHKQYDVNLNVNTLIQDNVSMNLNIV